MGFRVELTQRLCQSRRASSEAQLGSTGAPLYVTTRKYAGPPIESDGLRAKLMVASPSFPSRELQQPPSVLAKDFPLHLVGQFQLRFKQLELRHRLAR